MTDLELNTLSLSEVHHDEVMQFLAESNIIKPGIESDFKASLNRWERIWQTSLSLALSTSMRTYNQRIPVDTPMRIRTTIEAIQNALNPGNIDKMEFRNRKFGLPHIGDIHDTILKYFAGMLNREQLSALKPARISEVFYQTKVGYLRVYRPYAYTHQAKSQHKMITAIHKDFKDYKYLAIQKEFNKDAFGELNTNTLVPLIHILSKTPLSASDAQFSDDLYACLRSDRADGVFFINTLYQQYSDALISTLKNKVQELTDHKVNRLSSTHAAVYINEFLDGEQRSDFILSMSADELRIVCKTPNFINMNTIGAIAEILPISELIDDIPTVVLIWRHLEAVLKALTQPHAEELLHGLRNNHYDLIICDEHDLYLILKYLPRPDRTSFIVKLGGSIISRVISGYLHLEILLSMLPDTAWETVITLQGQKGMSYIIRSGRSLFTVISRLSPDRVALLISVLGPEVKNIMSRGEDLLNVLTYMPADSRAQWMAELGADYIHDMIDNPQDFYAAIRKLSSSNIPLSAYTLADIFGVNTIKRFMSHRDILFFAKNIKPELFIALLEALGKNVPKLIDDAPFELNLLGASKPISRAYKFYSGYQHKYDAQFSSDDIVGSIERLFEEINTNDSCFQGHFLTPAKTIAQSIIDECKKATDPESLLVLLTHKLIEIDSHEEPGYHYIRKTNLHNGEAAMRIMYCMVKLNQTMRPAPVSEPKLNTIADLRI